jgi:hypothetical protein
MLDTMNLVEDSIRTAVMPNPMSELADIERLYLTRGGYTDEQVDEFGAKLLNIISEELTKLYAQRPSAKVTLNASVSLTALPNAKPPKPPQPRRSMRTPTAPPAIAPPPTPPVSNVPSTHREPLRQRRALSVVLSSTAPARSTVARNYILFVPKDAAGDDDLKLLTPEGNDVFSARVDEVQPTISGILQFRLNMFAERILGDALTAMKVLVATAMQARRQ